MTVWFPDFVAFWNSVGGYFMALLVLWAIDTLLGVIVAVKQKVFDWAKLADTLVTNGAKILVYLALAFVATIPAELQPALETALEVVAWTAYTIVFLAMFGSVLGHAAALGVNVAEKVPGVKPTGGKMDRAR